MPNDTELVERWRSGDDRAGERLFERHYACLSRFFYNKVDAEQSPDLVQRTFLRCVEKFPNKREETTFKNFLFGIARMILLEHFRRYQRHDKRFDPMSHSIVDVQPTPSSVVHRQREIQVMLQALRRIPIELQVVLELYFWENLKAREIAQALGVPEGTARSRIRRARQLFHIEIEAVTADPDLRASTIAGVDAWVGQVRAHLANR
ncbi:MAG: sigma-70 family RNA polymerase sigma factor [Myxococcales bacterium]|nr:sigma-70 family RNA polymerase sigma factor [Myxococcales bacterium]